MNIYFSIAEINANIYVIAMIGAVAGFFSNIFGIGGGFVATPLLIAVGVPPYVATACATQQIVGSSFVGILTRLKSFALDTKLGCILAIFGIFGSFVGTMIVGKLKEVGYVDTLISLSYIVVMTTTALSIFLRIIIKGHNEGVSLVEKMPLQINFPVSERNISIVFLFCIGIFVGILTGIMGVGGGFVIVPVLTYVLKVKKEVIIGTSLVQMFIITFFTTAINVFTTMSLDLLLGVCLIIGGVVGSILGGIVGKFIKFEKINFLLAILILSVAVFFAFGLLAAPSEDAVFTVQGLS